ncbi:hypothetical protein LWI29_003542 [Acer saccharum]|uniref:Uncharacterized protein n=1 Tax=Acer saccharum TaxID=4024 RepID=A0AA39SXG2_ACESA|nr:hypothetical protein LWI29_003542 [Acer saccharum]
MKEPQTAMKAVNTGIAVAELPLSASSPPPPLPNRDLFISPSPSYYVQLRSFFCASPFSWSSSSSSSSSSVSSWLKTIEEASRSGYAVVDRPYRELASKLSVKEEKKQTSEFSINQILNRGF